MLFMPHQYNQVRFCQPNIVILVFEFQTSFLCLSSVDEMSDHDPQKGNPQKPEQRGPFHVAG